MESDKLIRVGVLGADRGITVAKGAIANGMKIIAVCDILEERVQYAARELNCQAFSDYDKMLASDIDAVIVANEATQHLWAVKAAMNAGKHVLCECMACFTMAEAVELVETVEAHPDLVYFFAENYPFFQQNQEMKRVFESGKIGKFLYGEGEYIHPIFPQQMAGLTYKATHWRYWLPATYYCTHAMGPVMLITNTRPVAVNAIVVPYDFDDPAFTDVPRVSDGTSVLLCKMDNGAAVKIVPWSTMRDHGQRYRICGNRGTLEWNQGDEKVSIRRCVEDIQCENPAVCKQSYMPEFPEETREEASRHGHGGGDFYTSYWFAHAIRTGEKPLIDVYRAVDMTMIGIQGYRSALNHSNTYEIPDLHDPAMRDKYRNDNWNPDPERPCDNKPAPSILGTIAPTEHAFENYRLMRAEEVNRQKQALKS